ncbi:hypothetical protein EVG20_g10172 [Dentipellis fragilis]|uniref:F-box domain-containing protein n=1 Tax=Dentipellis fragilis TaxID=205917 RepID=A0A4Y9XSN3_9AGAM|nr:hypothetical protein EVG20_g10172 [Dentipellis fragilis]
MLALEMDAVVQVLCSLHVCYNALAPVNRLPPEVLAHVFSFLQVVDRPSVVEYDPHTTEYDIGWIYATHVCRHWRVVALEHSSLWSNILLDLGSRWAKEFLRRARMAPITFKMVELGMATGVDVAGTIKQHLGHIREFSIAARNVGEVHSFLPSLRGAAPVLEKASLHDNVRHRGGSNTPMLPADLFGRTAPRLRHLKIACFRFSWPTLAFGSISHLDIEQDPRAPRLDEELHDFEHCLRALADMPRLEVIELKYALPTLPLEIAASFRASDTPRITLPNLQNLYLHDYVVECGLLLEHLIAPALLPTETRISCTLDTARGRGSAYILPWLASQVHALSESTIRALLIEDLEDSLHLVAWDSYSPRRGELPADPENPPEPAGKRVLQFGFDGLATEADEVFAELEAVWKLLPLNDLKMLSVIGGGYTCQTAQHWVTLLYGCQRVVHLVFTSFCELSLLKALESRMPMGRRGMTPLPALATVTFDEIELTSENEDLDTKIVKWLYLRRSLEEVNKVYIRKCVIDRKTRDRIEGAVSEVIWDDEDRQWY